MLFFDGINRSCVKFTKAKGGMLRCAKFQEGLKHPKCPGSGLKGGGRSQNYLRPGKGCKSTGSVSPRRKRRSNRK